jgi:hypothetical protein
VLPKTTRRDFPRQDVILDLLEKAEALRERQELVAYKLAQVIATGPGMTKRKRKLTLLHYSGGGVSLCNKAAFLPMTYAGLFAAKISQPVVVRALPGGICGWCVTRTRRSGAHLITATTAGQQLEKWGSGSMIRALDARPSAPSGRMPPPS